MTSTEFQSLAAVLNKLLAALGAGITLPEGTNETNLIQVLDTIAIAAEAGDAADAADSQQQSGNGVGPTSDFAMANKIARKQGVPFSQVWKSMPKSGVPIKLRNGGRRAFANIRDRKAFGFFG